MKKWMTLALVPALVMVMSATAFAQEGVESTGGDVSQEQNTAISQNAEGDGNEQNASIESGYQSAASVQYDDRTEGDDDDENDD